MLFDMHLTCSSSSIHSACHHSSVDMPNLVFFQHIVLRLVMVLYLQVCCTCIVVTLLLRSHFLLISYVIFGCSASQQCTVADLSTYRQGRVVIWLVWYQRQTKNLMSYSIYTCLIVLACRSCVVTVCALLL